MFNSILHYQYDQLNRYKGAYVILNNAMMDYYYTESFTYDLQGNIKTLERWVYSLDEPISEGLLQRTQYYPSGLPWNLCTETNFYPYRYNGKEFVEMHGLDEYDSEARWYYPAIMRTTTMDPHCEQYYDTSPYVWCNNNPIRNVDLNRLMSPNHITIMATYYKNYINKSYSLPYCLKCCKVTIY